MGVNEVITLVMLAFLLLGAVDYILGNKFGLGLEFENGIMSTGRLLMCMSGFMVLAPVMARTLGPIVTPFFCSFGADPSIIAGMLIANDSGGAALAMELAKTPEAGLFSGIIVGAMMGTTVMFNISLSMTYTTEAERPAAIYGLLAGIITIPLGCITGGFAAGFDNGMVLRNSVPVIAISLLLLLLLACLGSKIVPIFDALGKLILTASTIGLAFAAIRQLTGYEVIKGMDTLDTVFPIVGNISIFLAGAFPLLSVLRRVCAKLLISAGNALGVNKTSVTGLIMTLANGLPTYAMMHDMDDKGRMVNVAFLVSASCIFGDHMAYTSQVAPEICPAMMLGKAVAGISAIVVALILAPRLLPSRKTKVTEE